MGADSIHSIELDPPGLELPMPSGEEHMLAARRSVHDCARARARAGASRS